MEEVGNTISRMKIPLTNINIVSPLWILDSITNYEVQSPENYLLLQQQP